jgi:hypothetical protein
MFKSILFVSKGYPQIVIKPYGDSKTRYNKSLEDVQVTGDASDFIKIILHEIKP